MKKTILLLITTFAFSCNIFAEKADDSVATTNTNSKIQQQINSLLNQQKIIDAQLKNLEKYENLLIEKIRYQQEGVDWWLTIIGVFLTFFAIGTPIAAIFFIISINEKINEEIKKIKSSTEEDKEEIEKNKKEIEESKKEIEKNKKEIAVHLKAAKTGSEEIKRLGELYKDEETSAKQVEADPKSTEVDKQKAAAYKLQKDKKIREATKEWLKLLKFAETNKNFSLLHEVYFNLGYLRNFKKEFGKAIEYYSEANKVNSNHAKTYNNRGIAYKNNNQLNQALKDLNKAINIDPSLVIAYKARGEIYESQGNQKLADKNFSKAEELLKNQ